jgi:hypothetical protein
VLASERATLMPPLDDALQRFLAERVPDEAAGDADKVAAFGPAPRVIGQAV